MFLKKRSISLIRAVICATLSTTGFAQTQQQPVHIEVNLGTVKAPMKPIWAFFGYDEPNYTYMKDGPVTSGPPIFAVGSARFTASAV